MSTRTGWSFLFAVVFAAMSVGLITWWADDWAQSQKALVEVDSAVVGLLAPLCVDWVREWTKAQKKAEEVAESPYPPNPAGLLRADQHIVPFTGRDDEYSELREWCRDVKPPVRLMVGAGGVGKTRLALELGEHLTSVGWSVTVVAAGQEADALTTLRAATRHSSILLIVDYAETRTNLAELLRSVARHPGHVRVLLIARSAGDWWWQLGSDVPAVRDLVEAYPPLELPARVNSVDSQAELVHAAVPHFASALGVAAPNVEITVPAEVPLLVLHAAALLAVLRSQDRPEPARAPVADLDVLNDLLGHERRFWVHSAEQAALDLGPVVLRRAVAVACLFGALNESDGAEILRRVPDLRDDENRRLAAARWLAQLYPSGSGYWGPLQPELVAETHVIEQLKECPELIIPDLPDLPELRSEQARQMLTMLSRGAAHQSAGQELLEQTLRAGLERLVFPALEVVKVTGGALGRVLVRVLSLEPVTPTMLRKIQAAIPYPTTALAETAVVVTHRILDILPTDADIAETALWQRRLGIVLAQAGRADEALPHMDTAVRHYRILVETDRDRYLPDLARSLHHLSIQHAEQGRHADALPHMKQAVEYYRELVERNPGSYQADLASSLSSLGLWLAELGCHTAALEPLNEAVEYYRELVETDPDRYRSNLAQSLTNQRLSQSKVPPPPLSILEDGVESNRLLVETDRDRYLPDLAQSLHDLGNGYTEHNRYPDAVHHLTEALSCFRILFRTSRERYRPDVAACLNNLGANLTELGRYGEALPYAQKAVGLHRYLTKSNPARYRPELARSLDNLVVCLSKMGRHLEVLSPAQEAVDVHKDLAGIDPEHYRPELARALTNLSVSLSELRRHAEAWPAAKEAVEIYRVLVETDPHEYSPRLARALRNLAVDYSGLNRHAEADSRRQEADALSPGEATL